MSVNTATPFPVGVQLSHHDLGEQAPPISPSSTPPFLRGIMHHPISARTFVATVQYDASAAAIAAAVGVSQHHVEQLWLAGVTTPAQMADRRPVSKNHMRFTPQSLLDCTDMAEREPDTMSIALSVPLSPRPCERPAGLERERYADMFKEEPEMDKETIIFGNTLLQRLEKLAGCPPTPCVQPRTKRRNMPSRRTCNEPPQAAASQSQMVDQQGQCGFSERRTHIDIDVLCNGVGVYKTGGGLYRTAKSCSYMHSQRAGNFYFEVVLVDDLSSGGVCIGVSTDALQQNKLVGSDHQSCGLHSSGQVVCDGGQFVPLGRPYTSGDRVGCLVTIPESGDFIQLTYFINGLKEGSVKKGVWKGVDDENRKLYASLSLYKKESKAVIQCCPADWRGDGQEKGAQPICRGECN